MSVRLPHLVAAVDSPLAKHPDAISREQQQLAEPSMQGLRKLAAADLLICQAGCISHGACSRVKDHCKRTGKRCMFVDNPSVSSLARTLQEVETTP